VKGIGAKWIGLKGAREEESTGVGSGGEERRGEGGEGEAGSYRAAAAALPRHGLGV
jgi:hypothetical protein